MSSRQQENIISVIVYGLCVVVACVCSVAIFIHLDFVPSVPLIILILVVSAISGMLSVGLLCFAFCLLLLAITLILCVVEIIIYCLIKLFDALFRKGGEL